MMLDPELADVLSALPAGAAAGRSREVDWVAYRRQAKAVQVARPGRQVGRVDVEERRIPGPLDGPEVPVRIYRPRGAAPPLPVLVYFHGGGFTMGDLDMADRSCEVISAEGHCLVVSVDYRLAPEHPFPAGVEDCYAAVVWTAAHADGLDIDPARVAVGGGSAGGALAAAVALMARDRHGPALCYQLLVYPVIDDRLTTPSSGFADTPVFTRSAAESMWRAYLGGEGGAGVSPYAAPGRATSLAGLPPAYVLTAELDPLRDEGIDYALRLLHAGVSVELHQYAGAFHGFLSYAADTAVARRALEEQVVALRGAFSRPFVASRPAGAHGD
jgi:acetyl esterase